MPVPVVALVLALALGGGTRTMRVPVAYAETLSVQVRWVGTPVVLIPGLFGSAYGFRNVVSLLADSGFQTVVIEPLALGASSRPSRADYSLSAQAGRIAAVLDALGLREVVVVAHSTSASIAFRLALRRPELVRGIVAVEGGPAESAVSAGFRRAMTLAPLIRLAGVGFVRRRVHRDLVAVSGDTAWVSEAVIAEYTAGAAADLSGTLRAYRRMGGARESERLAPRLGELRIPVRLLLGEAPHDGGPPEAEWETMRRSLVGLSMESVVGAGHYLQEERPDVVAAAVRFVAAAPALATAH